MAIVAESKKISAAGTSALYTSTGSGALNIRLLNTGESEALIKVYLAASPTAPLPGEQIDTAKLAQGQALIISGEPVKAGESVVIITDGNAISLACRISGFVEA